MGIRFNCPSGHKLHVKSFLAGKRGVCPKCGAKFVIPSVTDAGTPDATEQQEGLLSGAPLLAESFAARIDSPPIDLASQSIVIAVDESTPAERTAERDGAAILPVADTMQITASDPMVLPPQPVISTPATMATQVRYISHRESMRRRQFKIAIYLLLAVILLALALVWVLSRGDDSPVPATASQATQTGYDALRSHGVFAGASHTSWVPRA
jgi:hypothetical protein